MCVLHEVPTSEDLLARKQIPVQQKLRDYWVIRLPWKQKLSTIIRIRAQQRGDMAISLNIAQLFRRSGSATTT